MSLETDSRPVKQLALQAHVAMLTRSYFEELRESCANYEACEALTPGDGVCSGGSSVISGVSFGMASSILTSTCQEVNVASAMRGECERLCRPAS
jgi:hypothetical protein